ncbi:methyltransferase domain-containing protein [Chitinophaga japonensis]|uniref:Methyltransferase family protein n=1 Tax=Chitinophaga japonensis TaxID=104662 RepID=A0A562T7V2_CHIJA|nr:methyltransferase domain-containing protein [Chitinophaga japonensis]TWI89224.1 methyltransferase family protein [Chitinophaga japonensis]
MNLAQRSYQPELLDADNIPFAAIRQNLRELDIINRWLGGHRISIRGLRQLLGDRRQVHICEIGCGGGDNLAALLQWCRQHHIAVTFTGIDIKPSCIQYAAQNAALQACAHWIVSDYREVTFTDKPDIIFSSLFCHHFTDDALVTQLQWMQANCRLGCFINDLHRHPLAYHSIRLLTAAFSRSYLVKNDAPLSVARGFTRQEWTALLQQAGVRHYRVRWQWAFRHLITFQRHEN